MRWSPIVLCLLACCRIDFDETHVADGGATYCARTCTSTTSCACVDFDESPELPADWELMFQGTTSGGLTTVDVQSPPRSLHLLIPPGPADGTNHFATFRRGLLATNLHIVMELDWKLAYFDETASAQTIQFASVFLLNSANTGIGYTWDGTTGFWFIGRSAMSAGTMLYPIARPPTSELKWTHVVFDVTFSDTGGGHTYVSFDGVEVLHEDNLTNAPHTTGPQSLVASPIAWALQGTPPRIDVYYDNVYFTVD